jgi:hypothetical protein
MQSQINSCFLKLVSEKEINKYLYFKICLPLIGQAIVTSEGFV